MRISLFARPHGTDQAAQRHGSPLAAEASNGAWRVTMGSIASCAAAIGPVRFAVIDPMPTLEAKAPAVEKRRILPTLIVPQMPPADSEPVHAAEEPKPTRPGGSRASPAVRTSRPWRRRGNSFAAAFAG